MRFTLKKTVLTLTKPPASPPVRLFYSAEQDFRVELQSGVKVCGATLWLANDVEIGKASHAIHFSILVNQVLFEIVLKFLGPQTFGPPIIHVCPVRVQSDIPRVFLVPARVLDPWQEFPMDYRKDLWAK